MIPAYWPARALLMRVSTLPRMSSIFSCGKSDLQAARGGAGRWCR
jgi:hypothetical protein